MTSTTRTVALVALNLVIVAVYAAGSGRWVASGDDWYRSLRRPEWQPPDAVFGIAWSYNFVMLAVVGSFVAARADGSRLVLWFVVFAASVAAALAWAWLFYVGHHLWPAAAALAVAAALTVVLTIVAWRVEWWMGAAMVPYAVWVCLATSLSVRYAQFG